MGYNIFRQHMEEYETMLRHGLNHDILFRQHMMPYEATLNRQANLYNMVKSCKESNVTEVAIYISNEMKANLNSPICAMIRKHNERAAAFLSISQKALGISHKVKAYYLWYNAVKKNAIWDYKPFILMRWGDWTCNKRKNALKFFHDIWANIHYGFIGIHVGFLEEELLSGAGLAQTRDAEMTEDEIKERFMKGGLKGLDDPQDQTAIKIGCDLYKNHKGNIYSALILEKLEEALRKGEDISIVKCSIEYHQSF